MKGAVEDRAIELGEYILENKLGAIDITAASLAMDNGLPLYCFGLDKAENIGRVIRGEKIGTKVNCK